MLLLIVGTYTVWDKEKNTTIKLLGEQEVTLEYGIDTFEDQGAEIVYKDKLLNTVKSTSNLPNFDQLGTYPMIYEYKTIFKNLIIERTINIVDTINPELILEGESEIILQLNNKFTEPGYNAKDNYDGDLSDKVKVTGEVDTSKEGTYTLTYTISDSSNNKTEATRSIKVYKPVIKQTDSKPGVIYLTFDDGPHPTNTDIILDILKEEGVKATFFVTGNGPDRVIKRAFDEGHTIALHTYSHDYKEVYSSVDNFYKDLDKISDRVYNITGQRAKIIRFPGGSSNTISKGYTKGIMSILAKDTQEKGYIYQDWNVDSMDATGQIGASNVYRNTIRELSKNYPNNVLMHDIHAQTAGALRDIIRYGKDNGFYFEALLENSPTSRHGINN